jgi:hypothetical protein
VNGRTDFFFPFSLLQGRIEIYVDPTFQCFINHGCDGSNNVGHDLTITENTADHEVIPEELLRQYSGKENIYNPARDRQVHFYSSAIPLRDISQGEELFDNYLGMAGLTKTGWAEDVKGLQKQCKGEGVGFITEYDTWTEDKI